MNTSNPACTSKEAANVTSGDDRPGSKSRALSRSPTGFTGKVLLAATASARHRLARNVPRPRRCALGLIIAVKLLSISTSTSQGSAAVLEDDRVLASVSYSDPHGHAERLFPMIDEVLRAAGVERASLDAVACDVGPGSFTGVRVGVASAKGIVLALNLKAIGVTSLEAVAAAAASKQEIESSDILVAALDAKKGELFLASFDASLKALLDPIHIPRGQVDEVLRSCALEAEARGGRVVLAGELAGELELPDAAWIGRLAWPRLMNRVAHDAEPRDDAAELEAVYVRPPDAKLPAAT